MTQPNNEWQEKVFTESKISRLKPQVVKLTKLLGFVVIILSPIILILFVLGPIAVKKDRNEFLNKYKLSKDFNRAEVKAIVFTMSDDREYAFYFYVLDANSIDAVSDQAAQILRHYKGKEELLEQLIQLQKEVTSLALFFQYIDIPHDFESNPQEYPDIRTAISNFIKSEFQLTLIGLCYKATHDQDFSFTWDDQAIESANKIRNLVLKMVNEDNVHY